MAICESSDCGFADHTGNVLLSAATALSTSFLSPSRSCAISSAVAGLKTGYLRPDSTSTHLPAIHIFYSPYLSYDNGKIPAAAAYQVLLILPVSAHHSVQSGKIHS